MSYFVCGHCQERTEIFGNGGGRRMAEEMQIPFLGEVPIDTRVRSGGDEGLPIVAAAPDAPAAQAFVGGREPGRGAGLHPEHAGPARHPDRVGLSTRGARRPGADPGSNHRTCGSIMRPWTPRSSKPA